MFGAFSEEYYGGGVLESWGGRVSNLMELPVCRAALQVSLEKITDVFEFLSWSQMDSVLIVDPVCVGQKQTEPGVLT